MTEDRYYELLADSSSASLRELRDFYEMRAERFATDIRIGDCNQDSVGERKAYLDFVRRIDAILKKEDRIDLDEHGVDDVVIHNVATLRLERMDADSFWMAAYKADGTDAVFWIGSSAEPLFDKPTRITVGKED